MCSYAPSHRNQEPNQSRHLNCLRHRYTKSALLDLHSEPPLSRFHYQLNFSNEIVDIICRTAPVISLRRAVFKDKLAGEEH
jgi:hypothetical protein